MIESDVSIEYEDSYFYEKQNDGSLILRCRPLPKRRDVELERLMALLDEECPSAGSNSSSEHKYAISLSEKSFDLEKNLVTKSGDNLKESSHVEPLIDSPKASSVTVAKTTKISDIALVNYSFVGFDLRSAYASMSNKDLEAELTKLCDHTYNHSSPQLSYFEVRDRYCAINMLMNERRLLPPRFRSKCMGKKFVPGMEWSKESKYQSNDRKIIDLHWLHSNGITDKLDDIEFRDLLSVEKFDFLKASGFVQKNWKSETRVQKILVLANHAQLQLAILSSTEVNDRWDDLRSKSKAILRTLRNAASSKPRLTSAVVEDFKLLWLAESLCDGHGLGMTAIIHGWLKGESPLATSTLSTKLKRLHRLLSPT